ncbi:hypothetical protein [Jidongwangia harbinensis]|uniref:hypothetical protein n=1 Tax=Jidongwangia harbinensis TaxID=2878561 RepID=UPI001CD9DA53|nr:hypothetical protein [Jidongwangia harbinensis]MCA2218725.1 hypothetical protein [Jidongwangia harbinensis]
MLFFVAVMVLVLAVSVAAMWPWEEDEAKSHDSDSPGTAAVRGAPPQTLEGALVAQLVAGEITSPQYRHAMANLAVRDADRHPLTVPPDTGPANA